MNELAGGINVRCGQVPVARATNGVTRRRPRCRTAFSLFLAAHFLRLTQREPRPDSAGGISRHITALSISVRCSIRRAGQRRLEKAADALKVSWGLSSCGSADQDIWKPLRGKLAQVSGKFLSGKEVAGRARRLIVELLL